MARYTAEVKRIASIYPGELPPIALNHGQFQDRKKGRRTIYELTPVPRDKARTKPCVIEVYDSFEDVLDVMAGERNAKMPKGVACEDIVADLLRQWTGNMVEVPAGASPGIIEIANTFPTQAEFNRMFEMQTAYANYLYAKASDLNRTGNFKEITGAMRVMAEWLGKSADWIDPSQVIEKTNCPACGGEIMPKVSICRHCGTKLRALPRELAILNNEPVQPEPAVA